MDFRLQNTHFQKNGRGLFLENKNCHEYATNFSKIISEQFVKPRFGCSLQGFGRFSCWPVIKAVASNQNETWLEKSWHLPAKIHICLGKSLSLQTKSQDSL